MAENQRNRRAIPLWLFGLVRDYPRRSPATAGYLIVLAVTDILVYHVLAPAHRHRLLLEISTNLHNLDRYPVRALAASMLVPDTRTSWPDNLLIIGFGVAICLAVLERRVGSARAAGVFLLGHVGATLVATAVIVMARRGGAYPESLGHGLDYGVSYGAIAAATALTWYLPLYARPLWAGCGVLYPLTNASWYGPVPDFTTVGHVAGALLGLAAGFALSRPVWRLRSRSFSRRPAGPEG